MTWTPTGEAYAIHRNLISSSTGIKNPAKSKDSRARFWSSDLWVMGPARSHCATLLDGRSTRFQACARGKNSIMVTHSTTLKMTLMTPHSKTFSNWPWKSCAHAKLISCYSSALFKFSPHLTSYFFIKWMFADQAMLVVGRIRTYAEKPQWISSPSP